MKATIEVDAPTIRPQAGPQTEFLASEADIVIYGGAAYGGKTYALLMEGGRHKDNPGFTFSCFRRSMPQIKKQGALWDTSFEIYPALGATPATGDCSWTFESGAEIRLAHLEDENTLLDYDGAQIALIGFDQLEQFTERQFFYMLSRNRSGCGVRPYCRATANPPRRKKGASRHWLRNLLDWWIKGESYPKEERGYPITERTGVVRYFHREDNKIIWVEKGWRDAEGTAPKSITFIPAKYSDNKIGMARDPGYVSNLNAQERGDRLRLKEGNWDVMEEAGMFDPAWFKIEDRAPAGMRAVRYWDRAATEATPKNPDPDWTAGAIGGLDDQDELWITGMEHFQDGPGGNERRIKRTAEIDGKEIEIALEQEPGSAGKDVVDYYQSKVLKGYTVHGDRPTGDKTIRAKPWCAKAERGKVHLVRGDWNHAFLAEVSTFPDGKKDQVDAVSGLHKFLTEPDKFTYGALAER